MYISKIIEQNILHKWKQKSLFSFKLLKGTSVSILLPPPNITGNLHLGHAFQYILTDIIVRFNILLSNNVLWQPGFDHAGIATQVVVAQYLRSKNLGYLCLNKKLFIKEIWNWKRFLTAKLKQQFNKLGLVINWKLERFTMDLKSKKSICFSFLKLFYSNLIYKKSKLINWDYILQTAISDLEIFYKYEQTYLWYIKYICNSFFFLEIATTRPETIFGDSNIVANYHDKRYKLFSDLTFYIPLLQISVFLFFSEKIDFYFGSGCIKITPAHDFFDYQMSTNIKNLCTSIFTKYNNFNLFVPLEFQGFYNLLIRKRLVCILLYLFFLTRKKKHQTKITKADRSEALIEPFITSQWFIKIKLFRNTFFYIFCKNTFLFFPFSWKNICISWFDTLEDWCVSRQLWWGHNIPVFYNKKDYKYPFVHLYFLLKYLKQCTIRLRKEKDVFDTWFSSSLWPLICLELFFLKVLYFCYPINLLVTGFDIIFFWVIRMIILCFFFSNIVPFKNIFITGLLRDFKGEKMSKSRGNNINPLKIIREHTNLKFITKINEKYRKYNLNDKQERNLKKERVYRYGVDSLRFYLAYLALESRALYFDKKLLTVFKNYCNKLWNLGRFFFILFKSFFNTYSFFFSIVDIYIFMNIKQLINKYNTYIFNYRFNLLAIDLHYFIKSIFANFYLEYIKIIHKNCNFKLRQENIKNIMLFLLQKILCIVNPIIPFISEKIYYKIYFFCNKLHTVDTLSILRFPFVFKNDEVLKNFNNFFYEFYNFIRCFLQNNFFFTKKQNSYFNFVKIMKYNIVLFYEFEFLLKKLLNIQSFFFRNKNSYTKFLNFCNILIVDNIIHQNCMITQKFLNIKEDYFKLVYYLFNIYFLLNAPLSFISSLNKQFLILNN